MPKTTESLLAVDVQAVLHRRKALQHLRVRVRGKVVTIESGPHDDAFPHARLRRVTTQYWRLEMPTHRGRWEPTPVEGVLRDVLTALMDEFAWTLAPID